MIWNAPAALWGLALVAGPVLVHLLVRRHATRVLFPAMRFVPAVRAAAVRLRAPSDRGLLLLRAAVVAAAVLAVAQPVLMTAARERSWTARVARAVIVDASPSVPAATADRLAERALPGAFASHRFAAADLGDGLQRATEWLTTAAAARREIVVVSDFQRGAIDDADVAAIPPAIGVTMIRAGSPGAVRRVVPVDGWRGARWEPSVAVDAAGTRVTWTRAGRRAAGTLTIRSGASDRIAADRAAEAAQSFGVPASEPSRRIDVAFAGADAIPDAPPTTPWIAAAAIALRASPLLAETGVTVRAGERDGVMAVATTLPATSALAPAVIRAALVAAAEPVVDPEAESASIDEPVLARWRRDAAPVGPAPGQNERDGRWLWALALALMAVEAIVRRRGAAREREAPSSALRAAGGTHADAA